MSVKCVYCTVSKTRTLHIHSKSITVLYYLAKPLGRVGGNGNGQREKSTFTRERRADQQLGTTGGLLGAAFVRDVGQWLGGERPPAGGRGVRGEELAGGERRAVHAATHFGEEALLLRVELEVEQVLELATARRARLPELTPRQRHVRQVSAGRRARRASIAHKSRPRFSYINK